MKRTLIRSIPSLLLCGASLALCPALRAQDAAPVTTGSAATSGTDDAGGRRPWGHRGFGGGGGIETLEKLTAALGLTPSEQAQIKPILDTLHTTNLATIKDPSIARPDKMARIKAARDAANTQILALLTPDQQAKFTAMLERMKNHHRPGAGGSPAAVTAAPGT